MNYIKHQLIAITLATSALLGCQSDIESEKIDREALVKRHNVHITEMDTLASLSVGNGVFAITVDATGLQTFPELYANGVSLGTQSDWGWHSFPNAEKYAIEESYKSYKVHGREIDYKVQWDTGDRREGAANYFRVNPHRLHLGLLGLKMTQADGSVVKWQEIKNINQTLDMWQGSIVSSFTVDGETVEVTTICHPDKDVIATRVKSNLIGKGQISLSLRFPYPDGQHVGTACNWDNSDKHQSKLKSQTNNSALILRTLDTTNYFVKIDWSSDVKLETTDAHEFQLSSSANELTAAVAFASSEEFTQNSFETTNTATSTKWPEFWNSGGAIDFSGSTDSRAHELERRIVLSQYLTRIQCAGIYPPQETGLTFNSWYGKFHLEMDWWHGVHYALWNRIDLLEKRMWWYQSVMETAKAKAEQQGYEGARWAKMTNPNGADSPSGIGEFLVWQQPHIIYFAELCYREHNNEATLKKYADLVFETAKFMASYAHFNEETGNYILGPALIPAQECFEPATTINPPFELNYWKYGLEMALKWQERLGLDQNENWKEIADNIAPLATGDDKYLVAESAPNTYSDPRWLIDHPMVLGAHGLLPKSDMIDSMTMVRTFDYAMENWNWAHTWGWDYPMVAMAATRLGKPDKAIEGLLMDVQKNTYLKNGHNYQDERLRIYLPGNGGILTAAAMMCAGYDGNSIENPGIPDKEDGWVVKWENLSPMP